MAEERMHYARYKKHFSDCEALAGSYDEATKSIIVLLPEGRMKKSGTRGQRYAYIRYDGVEKSTGRKVHTVIKAVSRENAVKQLLKITDVEWELESCDKEIQKALVSGKGL